MEKEKFNFYLQDKRADKAVPPVGTKEYPLFYIGCFEIDGQKTVRHFVHFEALLSSGIDFERFRVYACSSEGKGGKWYEVDKRITGLLSQSRP